MIVQIPKLLTPVDSPLLPLHIQSVTRTEEQRIISPPVNKKLSYSAGDSMHETKRSSALDVMQSWTTELQTIVMEDKDTKRYVVKEKEHPSAESERNESGTDTDDDEDSALAIAEAMNPRTERLSYASNTHRSSPDNSVTHSSYGDFYDTHTNALRSSTEDDEDNSIEELIDEYGKESDFVNVSSKDIVNEVAGSRHFFESRENTFMDQNVQRININEDDDAMAHLHHNNDTGDDESEDDVVLYESCVVDKGLLQETAADDQKENKPITNKQLSLCLSTKLKGGRLSCLESPVIVAPLAASRHDDDDSPNLQHTVRQAPDRVMTSFDQELCVEEFSKVTSTTAPASVGHNSVELLFDPILNCYYDPKTNKYYELS